MIPRSEDLGQSNQGLYVLMFLIVLGWLTILFGNWVFRIIGFTTIGLVTLSSLRVIWELRRSEVNKNGK